MFSIVIPYYNTKPDIFNRLLASIEKQTVKPKELELIIVDDHSARKLRPKITIDIPYKIIRNKRNYGPGYSRQRGIQYAKNDYVLFMDSDDCFVDPIAFSEYIKGIQTQADVIYPKYILVDQTVQIRHTYHVDIWGQCVKKSFLQKYGIQFTNYTYGEDLLFSLHMYNKANKIYQIEHGLILNYFKNPGSLTDQDPSIFGAIVLLELLPLVKYAQEHKLDWYKVNGSIQGNIMEVKHIHPDNVNLFLSLLSLIGSSTYKYTDAAHETHLIQDPSQYKILTQYIWNSLKQLCATESYKKRKIHLRFFKQCLKDGYSLRRTK